MKVYYLRQLFHSKPLTMIEIANELNMNYSTLMKKLQGVRRISPEERQKFAKYLDKPESTISFPEYIQKPPKKRKKPSKRKKKIIAPEVQ